MKRRLNDAVATRSANDERQESGRYDVFLAHTHADAQRAGKVVHQLEQMAITVFFSPRRDDLPPGIRYPQHIVDAQSRSKMTLVLVSGQTRTSHYQNEEIHTAIRLFCRKPTEHLVLPVYVDVIPDDPPYGLGIIQGIVWDTVRDTDAGVVAQEMAKCLSGGKREQIGSGIGPRETVFGDDQLPGQVFAAELLTQPVYLGTKGVWR